MRAFHTRCATALMMVVASVLPMALPGWILIGFIADWKAVLWFPVPVLALTFTALFAVFGVYLLILRVASASKFKEVLSYFQIAFSVLIFGVYNLVPRAVSTSRFENFDLSQFAWARTATFAFFFLLRRHDPDDALEDEARTHGNTDASAPSATSVLPIAPAAALRLGLGVSREPQECR